MILSFVPHRRIRIALFIDRVRIVGGDMDDDDEDDGDEEKDNGGSIRCWFMVLYL